MFEKVNPCHPDKVADRIAGAVVDLAYTKKDNATAAVEVLLGHGRCTLIIESNCDFTREELEYILHRIVKEPCELSVTIVPQDEHLANNQAEQVRCGDNGIFCGAPVTAEQRTLTDIAHKIYEQYPTDGKYIISGRHLTICQSCADADRLQEKVQQTKAFDVVCNPLGYWTGGTYVDAGATNRKLGSDMGDGVTGGGLHGKDLSKADVSVNIWCHLKAQFLCRKVRATCNIGDTVVRTSEGEIPYSEILQVAKDYIDKIGGFERFAEWGLV